MLSQYLYEEIWWQNKTDSETETYNRKRQESEEVGKYCDHILSEPKSCLLQNPKIPPASAPQPAPAEYMCLMRAVYKNEKISTIVHAKDVNKYQLAYCNLLKSNMDGLKRQKKVKTKKAMQ